MRFAEGVRDLQERVGKGKLEGIVEVDQVYAFNQHEGYWLTGPNAGVVIRNHPRGGQAKFLEAPFLERLDHYMHALARRLYEFHGLEDAMIDSMEELAGKVYELAPRENDVLRNSAHPQVFSNGRKVYDRPPTVPRLSPEELKLLRQRHPQATARLSRQLRMSRLPRGSAARRRR